MIYDAIAIRLRIYKQGSYFIDVLIITVQVNLEIQWRRCIKKLYVFVVDWIDIDINTPTILLTMIDIDKLWKGAYSSVTMMNFPFQWGLIVDTGYHST